VSGPEVNGNSAETTTQLPLKEQPKRRTRSVLDNYSAILRRKYGKLPLLPGESEEAAWKLWGQVKSSQGFKAEFEGYLAKELTDELLLIRRLRTANTALLNAYIQDPRPAPFVSQCESKFAQAQLPSPEAMLENVPVAPDEAAAILRYCGLDKDIAMAVAVLETQDLRRELSSRMEAAERRYYEGHQLFETLRESRAQLAAMKTSVDFIKGRTKYDLYRQREKPQMPRGQVTDHPEHVPQSPWLVEFTGFTDLGRSILGPPPVLHCEREEDYARAFNAIRDYFGSTEFIDNFLVNDATSATWEKRRLRHAADTIFCLLFRIKVQKLAGRSDAAEELAIPNDKSLNDAVESSGIDIGHASALTFGQLSKILATLDDEIAALDYRRRKALNALITSRAKRVRTGYYNARQLEMRRMHEWHTHKGAVEFNRKHVWNK
jgi:hypothetical protein